MKKISILLLLTIFVFFTYYVFPEKKLPPGFNVDKIMVVKNKRIMEVYSKGKLLKTYKISLGRNPVGDKESEGDKRTPEGDYFINAKNDRSGYHKNLGISYPNKTDVEQARSKKLKPGGDIKIHGIRNGIGLIGKFHRWIDWTAGCIAVTDSEIDELYESVEIGTPITILP